MTAKDKGNGRRARRDAYAWVGAEVEAGARGGGRVGQKEI